MRSIRIGDTIIEVPEFIANLKGTKKYWLIVLVIWMLSGIYVVGPDENGVVHVDIEIDIGGHGAS